MKCCQRFRIFACFHEKTIKETAAIGSESHISYPMVKMMDNKIDRLDDHFASLVERSMEYGLDCNEALILNLSSHGSQRIVYWSVPHCIDKYFFHIMKISSFISLNFNQNDICLDILVL